jgi:hypothetical protein
MQIVWLEKMASAGEIRPEAKAKIYEDCSALLKLGADEGAFSDAHFGRHAGNAAVGAAILGGIKLFDLMKVQRVVGKIQKSRDAVMQDPAFQGHLELADKRFADLAKVAPTIAADPKKAKDLIGRTLHTGFSNDDMNHLAVLQAVYTAKDPGFAGKVDSKMSKKASAERLGEMYADVFCLVKEAGIMGGIGDAIRRGGAAASGMAARAAGGIRPGTVGQALKNVALVSSIPLLAGIGHGVINQVQASRDSKVMSQRLRASYEEAMRRDKLTNPDQQSQVALNDNPAEAYRAFETLVHFAPHVALHPDSARTFMARIMGQAQDVELPDIKQLTDIERNLASAGQTSPFMAGFSGAATAFGLGEGLRAAIKDTTEPLRQQNRQMFARDLGVNMKNQSSKGS